jgi:putative flippase GtrA
MTPFLRQALRFAVVGATASAAHVVVALTLIELPRVPVLTANGLAFLVAVVVSYSGNHSWTFQREGHHQRHLPRFLTIALIGLALNQAIIFGLVTIAGFSYLVGIFAVIAIVPAASFVLSRRWAFIEFRSGISRAPQLKDPMQP